MNKNILFILVDCLRSDRCPPNAEMQYPTPFMDYLFKNGTSFTQAVSVTSFTSPCVASIFTGMYPFFHGIEWFSGNKLNPQCTTISEILRNFGYTTCAMVTGPLGPQLGLDRGFEYYLYRDEKETIYSDFKHDLEKCIRTTKKPWFIFVHLWELHYPIYFPKHLKKKYRFSLDMYDRALSCLDHQLLSIVKKLDLDDTIIILHADHGERLPGVLEAVERNLLAVIRENVNDAVWFRLSKRIFDLFPSLREKQGHGFHLYENLIRVPLIFAGDGFPKRKIVEEQVGQIDILPTILDALDLLSKSEIEVQGRSLLSSIKSEKVIETPIYIGPAGIVDGFGVDRSRWLEGIRTAKWKGICIYNKNKTIELYDLENDRNELNNLVETSPEIAHKLEVLLKNMKKYDVRTRLRMTSQEEKKIKERLRALGYID